MSKPSKSIELEVPVVDSYPRKEHVGMLMSPMRTIVTTSSTAQGGGGSFENRKPIGEIGCCESRMRSH